MSILSLARRADTMTKQDVAAGILVWGPSGNGKTHFAVSGGKPIVALMERNGMSTILRANPDAMVVLIETSDVEMDLPVLDSQGNPTRDGAGQVVMAKQTITLSPLNVFRELVRSIKTGEAQAAGYDRLVVDGLTELQRMFKDEILDAKPADKREMTLKDWGSLADRMRRLLRTLRALPMPIVATALDNVVQDEDGRRFSQPSFEGRKTAGEVAQYFSAVGYAVKHTTVADDGTVNALHRVMWDSGDGYLTKSCGPGASGIIDCTSETVLDAIAMPTAPGAIAMPSDMPTVPGAQPANP